MNRVSFRCVRLFVLGALAAAAFAHPAAAQRFPEPLDPATYTSPNGKFTLTVDPSDIYGRYAGSYRVVRDGKEVWAKTLPFTFCKAAITDTGVVVGFAYTLGEHGFGEKPDEPRPGDLVVAIIDPAGKLRLKQATKRQESRMLHAVPFPTAHGLVVDGPNDRLIVRVNDYDRNSEIWWTYRLSSGAILEKRTPLNAMRDAEPDRWILDAKLVPGTPLVLLHWWRYDGNVGARYTLVDPAEEAKPVWSLVLAGDYTRKRETAQDKLQNWIREHGGILRADQPNQFDLFVAAESKRVTFAVRREQGGPWKVSEVGRALFVYDPPPKPEAAAPIGGPLKELPPIALQVRRATDPSPIRDVRGFALDGKGRIAFIREDEKASRFLLVDQAGKQLRDLLLPANPESDKTHWSGHCWVGGNHFIVTLSEIGREGKAKAWWVDVESGKVEPIPGFDCPSIKRIVGAADGRFVVLASLFQKYTIETTVAGYDAKGRRQWTRRDDDNDKSLGSLFSVEDVALSADGEVIVLENIVHQLKVFDLDGGFHRSVYLEKTWNRKPEYLSHINADVDGGCVVEDFAKPRFIRTKRDGTVRESLDPKYADGRAIGNVFDMQPDGKGGFWICDGHSVLRLNDKGVVERILGAAPSADRLERIASIAIDSRGRIDAVDSRTGSIQVFDPSGKLLHVCRTKPTDFSSEIHFPTLSIDDKGDVYLGLSDGMLSRERGPYAHFSAEGKRLEDVTFPSSDCSIQPKSGAIVEKRFEDVQIADATGKTLRIINRRPDGHWLANPHAVAFAPDGSMAVVAQRMGLLPPTVNLYKPNGDPIRTIELPNSAGPFPPIAYNGRRLIVAGEDALLIFDATGQTHFRGKPPVQVAKGMYYHPYILPGGHELAFWGGKDPVLHRFELP
jgi:hypothetical protein